MVDATITKRLHVGGLTPAITTQHIKERFSSFGVVSEVEELGVDALGQPRPFTFLTLSTTPLQLKKCLNILSGSFWRGTQLRLAEAKPKYTERYAIPTPTAEEKRKVLEKKRKRVESKRGEDVGKLSQDFRLVNSTIAKKKKFWLVDEDEEDGRMVRPLTIRPSHPIGKPLVDNKVSKTQEGKKRVRGPPGRLRRRVINPIAWGSIYIKGDQLGSITETQNEDEANIQKGEWEFEEIDDSVVDEEGLDEDGRMVVGIWKKRDMNGEVIEESLVRSKKRRVSIGEVDISEYGSEDLGALEGGEVDSPLFGNRDLPAKGSESPLFPSRQIDDVHTDEEERGDNETLEDGNAVERASSPLFPLRVPDQDVKQSTTTSSPSSSDIVDQLEQQPSSPLFPTRSIETPNEENEAQQQPPSPLFPVRNEASTAQQASSPLFPARALQSRSPSPPPQRKPALTLPSQILTSARAERTSALGVLGSLLGDVSPPAKKEKVVWEVYPESDEDDEVEVGRGRSKSAASEISSVAQDKIRDEVMVDEEPNLNLDIPVDGESSSGSTSSSGSGSSSGDLEEGEGMDVDPPAGNEKEEESSSGSGSRSGSSSSGSGSGDDDEDESSESGSSSDSGSDSEEDSDSESDSEDEGEDKATDKPSVPTKPSGLKDMFAPTTSTPSTLNFGSTSASAGFSLLANLGDDIELDEEMDIPLPPAQADHPTGHKQEEDELQPLPLNQSSGRGKIKFDPSSSDIPLFFTLPTEAGPSGGERKGESRNLYNELHIGVPPITQPEYEHGEGDGEEEIPNVPLPGFSRQPGENDESMKAKWTNEKLELTQGWKKRFREAKKSKRRKGGEEVE
ncbi:hypothetical protein V865_007303 [Kwoniella europaea PYCC6329]|uniref:RRM domain-containing protein n=1 Tax=Kwoniella europaea PYCC6329 TaxID=1423913 RepID=A0AAX4KRT4_9TREE